MRESHNVSISAMSKLLHSKQQTPKTNLSVLEYQTEAIYGGRLPQIVTLGREEKNGLKGNTMMQTL